MKLRLLILPFFLAMSLPYVAQSATVTATCKDGTTYSGPTRSGACKGHHGVQSWSEATPTVAGTTAAVTGGTATATKSQAPVAAKAPKTAAAQPVMPAKPGTPGQVWVNTSSKVYHCAGDKWYGKTKAGTYMSEADAKAKGFHAAKSCSS